MADWKQSDYSMVLVANARRPRVSVGLGSCGIAAGAQNVYDVLAQELANAEVDAVGVGCRGLCYAEPIATIAVPGEPERCFGNVDPHGASLIARSLIEGSRLQGVGLEELALGTNEITRRRVMDACGIIDPFSIDEYLAIGDYKALKRALSLSPDEVIDMVEASGLRGRGGAGFPTGKKWRACATATEALRSHETSAPIEGSAPPDDVGQEAFSYLVMNGDEGDPGAYMNRALLESDPHKVLEGVLIAAYAVRARHAYLFVRAEYSHACTVLNHAIAQARGARFIGENVLGSKFSIDVSLVRGAGAYLNGEETALIRVLEDGVCLPRPRPPYPTERGLWGRPTCINNVETFANIGRIVLEGPRSFREEGSGSSPGTKLFSVAGAVDRGGLLEVPLGTTIGEIANICGARDAKAVQVGGPSGGVLPLSSAEKSVDYESPSSLGAIMGSGGFVFIGRDQCMVETSLYFMRFSRSEACGRCRSCSQSLDRCIALLEALTRGQADMHDIEDLRMEAASIPRTALCGLCKSASNVVLSALRYFPEEFAAHTKGSCPGLVCKDLVSYEIDQTRCQGERCCLLTCPGNAIKGRFGTPGRIVSRLCQKCGLCAVSCPYGAVRKTSPPQ